MNARLSHAMAAKDRLRRQVRSARLMLTSMLCVLIAAAAPLYWLID